MRAPLLPPTRCQFPLWGDGPPTHRYCGGPTIAGSSYCAAHHARCWTFRPFIIPAGILAAGLA